jgi:hypothetical protein
MMGYALFAAAFVLIVDALVGENGYLATMRPARPNSSATAGPPADQEPPDQGKTSALGTTRRRWKRRRAANSA